MQNDPLSLICCPVCKNSLNIRTRKPGDEMTGCIYSCSQCSRDYRSENGIIRFIEDHEVARFSPRMNYFRAIYAAIYTPVTRIMFIPCGGENKARHEVLDRLEKSPGGTIPETGIGSGDNLLFIQPCSGQTSACHPAGLPGPGFNA